MHEAKTHLSRLVQEVRDGTEPAVVIAIGGKPAAQLVPYSKPRRVFGIDRGLFEVPDDFDEPDPDIIKMFEESD
jgi:prevent-host-death family protein